MSSRPGAYATAAKMCMTDQNYRKADENEPLMHAHEGAPGGGECSSWYALKVFHNKVNALEADLTEWGRCECYVPRESVMVEGRDGKKQLKERPAVGGLMFVKVSESILKEMKGKISGTAMFYPAPDGSPARIPDHEMTIFRLVTSRGSEGLEYLPGDTSEYAVGQRVRVLEGPFCGAEGYIRRIHGDRRLVVTINGVCAVAKSYIPACFLEKISN